MTNPSASLRRIVALLGLPGGPCHIIRKVEEERLPEPVKEDLIEDVERGVDFDPREQSLLWKNMTVGGKGLFKRIELTSHVQYRMDLRGVTTLDVAQALDEFGRWWKAHRTAPKDRDVDVLMDLENGQKIEWEARNGLTVVFIGDVRAGKARLVTTWWTGIPDPGRPRPGECDLPTFLDRKPLDRPAILG